MSDDAEIIQEFLIESNELLSRLDQELIELESHPEQSRVLVDSIFRTMHTIKGSSGLLGFGAVEKVTHAAENLLSKARSGAVAVTPAMITAVLGAVDAVKRDLASIESSGAETGADWRAVIERLEGAGEEQPDLPGEARAGERAAAGAGAAASASGADPNSAKGSALADSTIRVDVGLLDRLMNLVGELVLARNQILQFSSRQEDGVLNGTSQRLSRITTELQESVMKTRMQPIGVVWNKLPRLVRDLAHACGKQIGLDMEGSATELDRTIIEAIKDPLTHLIRNCCDHGIETPEARVAAGKPPRGTISLRAWHEGGQVNIEISDDGAGIDVRRVKDIALRKGLVSPERAERISDRDAANLIFVPGFSTAARVTNVSGRGVGMDVVRANIEKIGGTVDLSNRPGHGLSVKVKIPLTLAIIPGLVVTAGDARAGRRAERFVIPQASLLELIRIETDDGTDGLERIQGARFYRRRGNLLPVVPLAELLRLGPAGVHEATNIVVLQAEGKHFGLLVDGIGDTQEIVVKPMGKQLKTLECYAGSTIMGDGAVALILDVAGIAKMSGLLREEHAARKGGTGEPLSVAAKQNRQTVLLFRAGSYGRLAVPLSRVARLEEFPSGMIERAAGRPVIQYRGDLLRLVSLAPLLDPGEPDTAGRRDPAQAIVFEDGGRRLGLLVDGILDIVEDEIEAPAPAGLPFLAGSAVVGGRVADFLQLEAVLQAVCDPPPPGATGLAALEGVLRAEMAAEEVSR